MKYQFLLTTLFIFSFSTLPVQACLSGNSQSTNYIRRENNRCEGIQPRNVGSGINLISGSGKYVVIIKLGTTTRIIMMNKIPDSANMII